MKRFLLALLLAACAHKEQHQLDVHAAEHDEFAGNVSLRLDAAQHAQLEGHEIDTAGPGERIDRDFAALPDGGVTLAHESVTRWGGSTSENWLKTALNAEEHLELDAGVMEHHDASADVRKVDEGETHPAVGCQVGFGLWGLALLGAVAIAAWLALALRRRAVRAAEAAAKAALEP